VDGDVSGSAASVGVAEASFGSVTVGAIGGKASGSAVSIGGAAGGEVSVLAA